MPVAVLGPAPTSWASFLVQKVLIRRQSSRLSVRRRLGGRTFGVFGCSSASAMDLMTGINSPFVPHCQSGNSVLA